MDLKKLFGYEGKNVVITGSASGMSKSATELLLELGANVYAIDINKIDLPVTKSFQADLSKKEEIDKIIKEDVPYSDITTEMLGIGEENGTISFYTRSEGVIAGAGLAGKIFTKLGCEILSEVKDGEKLSTGSLILKAKGKAGRGGAHL